MAKNSKEMEDKNKQDCELATDAGEQVETVCEDADAGEVSELEKLQKEAQALREELAALNDKYLRMIAEYDNFRKRSQRERENIYTDAVSDTVTNILPIGDDLARAAKFTDPESVGKGISMMQKGFESALGKMGITEIDALGKKFDPALHSAVMHVEDDEHGEGEVIEVFQKGYKRGDKVLRYAMVKVAN